MADLFFQGKDQFVLPSFLNQRIFNLKQGIDKKLGVTIQSFFQDGLTPSHFGFPSSTFKMGPVRFPSRDAI